ncbi:FixH family protein [soil metagenome]
MRINWGVKITIAYTTFVLFMGTMVYMCTRQHFDLVSEDYYAQELKYQQVIDGTNNAKDLKQPVLIDQSGSAILIKLPTINSAFEKGEILFYRPSNSTSDFTVAVTSNATEVSKEKMHAGLYKVKINWTAEGKHFYDEQSLDIK